jgi:heme o synthase
MRSDALVVAGSRTRTADFVALAKPRLNVLVVASTLAGYMMAGSEGLGVLRLLGTLLGTGFVAAGASAFNQVLERDLDALMRRTRMRPLPDQRLQPVEGLVFAGAIAVTGLLMLVATANLLAAGVAFITLVTYVAVYTPLKRRSSFGTVIGAIPGALPPIIGWAAARGTLSTDAWTLFGIVFLWQLPHFLAIAWIYREDYARGGLPMLPVLDPAGVVTGRQAVANSLALLLVSVVPTIAGLTGRLYFVGAVGLGVAFTSVAVWSAIRRTAAAARGLFLASILYLLALCTLLLVDRI